MKGYIVRTYIRRAARRPFGPGRTRWHAPRLEGKAKNAGIKNVRKMPKEEKRKEAMAIVLSGREPVEGVE